MVSTSSTLLSICWCSVSLTPSSDNFIRAYFLAPFFCISITIKSVIMWQALHSFWLIPSLVSVLNSSTRFLFHPDHPLVYSIFHRMPKRTMTDLIFRDLQRKLLRAKNGFLEEKLGLYYHTVDSPTRKQEPWTMMREKHRLLIVKEFWSHYVSGFQTVGQCSPVGREAIFGVSEKLLKQTLRAPLPSLQKRTDGPLCEASWLYLLGMYFHSAHTPP